MARLDNKIAVLTKIRDVKDILFGQFSETLTKEKRVHEWKKICEFCKALGLIGKEKDFSYARDVFWSNIKRATLAKKDNANKTEGRKNKKMTPLDDIVMEIISNDSPILEGLGIRDTMTSTSSQNIETKKIDNSSESSEDDYSVPSQNIRQVNENKQYKRFVTKRHEEHENLLDLKRRKLQLQLKFIELQNYKTKLEIYEMEKRLNVSHSDFIYVSSDDSSNGT